MAYGQQVAKRAQETYIRVGTSWTACEASSTWPSTTGVTTPLERRTAIKIFNSGTGGASRIALSYDNTSSSAKHASHWLGAGQFVVEPASTGLKLYARAKLASGVNHIRIVVTEYGE